MNTRLSVTLLVVIAGIALASALYFYVDNASLRSELENLSSKYNRVLSDYNSLYEKYEESLSNLEKLVSENEALYARVGELQRDLDYYTSLSERYRESLLKLEEDYRRLEENYTKIQLEYLELVKLKKQYEHLLNLSLALNMSLSSVVSWLQTRCCIPDAFTNTLVHSRIVQLAPFVYRAGVDPGDFWLSVQRIYNWVRRNVAYVHDTPLLTVRTETCDPEINLCYYEFAEVQDYVQDPVFTAYYGQGDCDDQAILVYAMVSYYTTYIYRGNITMWIAIIELGNRLGHAAVFIPSYGGRLTILDPAGAYLTTNWLGYITANPALEELNRYSNYWREYGGVTYLELYEIDTRTGGYNLVAKGDIETVAQFIASFTG